MPSPAEFLKGFGIEKNAIIGGNFQINSVSIEHIIEKHYQRYKFPIEITIIGKPDTFNIDAAMKSLDNISNQIIVIYSKYGNPYKCKIDPFEIVSSEKQKSVYGSIFPILKLKTTGHAERI